MAMLEVKDLHVYYGVIHALKGISFEVKVFLAQKKDPSLLRARILQRFRPIRSWNLELPMYRKGEGCFLI